MKDILKEYNKNKTISNFGIVVCSLIIAFGINFFAIDGTQMGKNLKISILNANNQDDLSDIYFEKQNDKILVKAGKNMQKVKSLSLSVIYNSQNITLKNFSNNGTISNIGEENGISSIIINFSKSKNINKNDKIIEFKIEKNEDKSENINIINANFTDFDGEIYMLSTSGITF